jgi:hypothetical protein
VARKGESDSPQGRSLASPRGGLGATSILSESPRVRFIDALVGMGAGTVYGIWAASRPTGAQRLGWALGGALLGGIAFVEGGGAALKYGGGFIAAASATVLGLEATGQTTQGL